MCERVSVCARVQVPTEARDNGMPLTWSYKQFKLSDRGVRELNQPGSSLKSEQCF